MTEAPQSFFRRWRVVILLGVLVVVVMVTVREFVDYRSNSPIVDPHSTVINEMSLHSPRARSSWPMIFRPVRIISLPICASLDY